MSSINTLFLVVVTLEHPHLSKLLSFRASDGLIDLSTLSCPPPPQPKDHLAAAPTILLTFVDKGQSFPCRELSGPPCTPLRLCAPSVSSRSTA